MSTFPGRFRTGALTQTCQIEVPATAPGTPESSFGVEGVSVSDPTLVTLTCLEIPPKESVDRTNGLLVRTPMQLLIYDPSAHVTNTRRIQYNDTRYGLTIVTRFQSYVQVTLKEL